MTKRVSLAELAAARGFTDDAIEVDLGDGGPLVLFNQIKVAATRLLLAEDINGFIRQAVADEADAERVVTTVPMALFPVFIQAIYGDVLLGESTPSSGGSRAARRNGSAPSQQTFTATTG